MLKIVATQSSSVGVLQKISWLGSSVAFVDIYSCIFKGETSRLLPTLRWHHACIFYTWCLYSVHTMYILHLHRSYLLTLVAVVEHMVGFRTIACLSLGLVIFLMFFSPLTHNCEHHNWCFLLFFVCFFIHVLSLMHMFEFWLPNPETLIFIFSFVQSCKIFKKGLSLWAHNNMGAKHQKKYLSVKNPMMKKLFLSKCKKYLELVYWL